MSDRFKRFGSSQLNVFVRSNLKARGVEYGLFSCGLLDDSVYGWDGSEWYTIGVGTRAGGGTDNPTCLVIYNDKLIVGGHFTEMNGVSANRIAQYDPTTGLWTALGSGLDNAVLCLTVIGSDLVVGGSFTTAGGVAAKAIAKWNGSSWSAYGAGTGTPYGGSGPVVYAAREALGSLYIGGIFEELNGTVLNNMAQWTGAAWNTIGPTPGRDNTVYALNAQGAGVVFGGAFTSYMQRWNGLTWGSFGTPNDEVRALRTYGSNLIAAGKFTTIGGASRNRVAYYDGAAWNTMGDGLTNTGLAIEVVTVNGQQKAVIAGESRTKIWDGTTLSNISALSTLANQQGLAARV